MIKSKVSYEAVRYCRPLTEFMEDKDGRDKSKEQKDN